MTDFIAELVQWFLLVSAALFPIINPPGTALLFHAMTRHLSQTDRAWLATRVAIYACVIVLTSLLIGGFVLSVFGISVPVLRVAGGIVVSMMGWQMLNTAPDESETRETSVAVRAANENVAFYPLTMPLTAGPGTIAACVALGTARPDDPKLFFAFLFGGLGAVVAIGVLIYFCFRYAGKIERALGKAGSEAFSKLFAFILICIGIQTLWLGLSQLWPAATPG